MRWRRTEAEEEEGREPQTRPAPPPRQLLLVSLSSLSLSILDRDLGYLHLILLASQDRNPVVDEGGAGVGQLVVFKHFAHEEFAPDEMKRGGDEKGWGQ